MSYFHCKVIDTIRVCIKVEEIDPVTPIAEADFVTGNVSNPIVGHQEVFIYKYDGGTAVNGDTAGTIIAIDDASISLKGEIQINTGALLNINLLGEGDPVITTTTDATTTVASELPVRENLSITISIKIHAVRTDASEETAWFDYNYSFLRLTAGSLSLEKEILVNKDAPGGVTAELVATGNNVELEVSGKVGQTWDWSVAEFELSYMEVA